MYQPPESDLRLDNTSNNEFYVVSKNKFILLFMATLGFYHLYWFYKNWHLYSLKHNENMWPVMRGIFSIFFTFSLFEHFYARARDIKQQLSWRPEIMATLYIIVSIAGNVTNRLSSKGIWVPYTDFIAVLTLPMIAWIMLSAQKVANVACNDPAGESNSKLTLTNYLWIILGMLMWLVIAIGMYSVITETNF